MILGVTFLFSSLYLIVDFDVSGDFVQAYDSWMKEYKEMQLPTADELATFIEKPLASGSKIYIPQIYFDDLIQVDDYRDRCRKDDLDIVFEASDSRNYMKFYDE